MEENLKNYRLLLLVSPSLSDEAVKTEVSGIQGTIEAEKGSIKAIKHWGLRDLAYQVEGQDKGYYTHLQMVASTATIDHLNSNLKVNDKVLRFLITRA